MASSDEAGSVRARHLAAHGRPAPVGALLRRPRDAVVEHMRNGFRRAGHELHRAHMVVFQQIDHDGTRATELARRVGVTKQTMVHLVDELTRRGYLERVADPSDGRAKVVRMTARGWEVHELATELIEGLDRRWEARLGRDRFAELRDLLAALDASLGDDVEGGGDIGVSASADV